MISNLLLFSNLVQNQTPLNNSEKMVKKSVHV